MEDLVRNFYPDLAMVLSILVAGTLAGVVIGIAFTITR